MQNVIYDSNEDSNYDGINKPMVIGHLGKLHGDISLRLIQEIRSLEDDDIDDEEVVENLNGLISHYPTHAWALVSEMIPIVILKAAFDLWGGKDKAEILLKSDRHTVETLQSMIDDSAILAAIKYMDVEDLEVLSDRMSALRFSRLLSYAETDSAEELKLKRRHSKHHAGRYMSFDFLCVYSGSSVAEVIMQFQMLDDIDNVGCLFVINKYEEVIGVCNIGMLLRFSGVTIIDDIMEHVSYKVRVEESVEKVIRLVERLQLTLVPVIDSEGVLIGVISYNGILEMMNEVARETIDAITGTYSEEESRLYVAVTKRMPWLLVTICSGITSALSIACFSSMLGTFMSYIIFFIPLITGMTGNVGIQSSTMMVRRIAISGLSRNTKFCYKEILSGVITGSFFGVFLFVLLYGLWDYTFEMFLGTEHEISSFLIAASVGGGMLVASIWASCLGVIAPLVFAWLGVDPALAAGPIVTAMNDVVAMVIYLNIARLIFWLAA